MAKKKDEPIDLFKEGKMKSVMSKSLKESIVDKKTTSIISEEDQQKILDMVEKGETQWDVLKNMIDNDLTKRFIAELQAMPGKDFVRNYLKLIEHFKPKLIRADQGDVDKPDLNITIETMIINSSGEKQIIDITELQETDKIIGEQEDGN